MIGGNAVSQSAKSTDGQTLGSLCMITKERAGGFIRQCNKKLGVLGALECAYLSHSEKVPELGSEWHCDG